eukprot:3753898-Pyramimonas_sp.AAC.3
MGDHYLRSTDEAGARGGSGSSATSAGDARARDSLNSGVFTAVCSGAISGVAVAVVGHPFDTLKVRLQTSTSQLVSDGMRHSIQHFGPLS